MKYHGSESSEGKRVEGKGKERVTAFRTLVNTSLSWISQVSGLTRKNIHQIQEGMDGSSFTSRAEDIKTGHFAPTILSFRRSTCLLRWIFYLSLSFCFFFISPFSSLSLLGFYWSLPVNIDSNGRSLASCRLTSNTSSESTSDPCFREKGSKARKDRVRRKDEEGESKKGRVSPKNGGRVA